MKKTIGFLALLVLTAAIAYAVPLTPGMGVAPGPVRQATTWHSYGGFSLSSTTITIGSSATWYPVKNATDNLWAATEGNGITLSLDNLVIANQGDYQGHMTISVSGTNGHDVFVRSFNVTDNVANGNPIGATVTGASNFQNISLPLYIEATADNTIVRFEVMNNSAGADVTVRSAIYQLFYLHD